MLHRQLEYVIQHLKDIYSFHRLDQCHILWWRWRQEMIQGPKCLVVHNVYVSLNCELLVFSHLGVNSGVKLRNTHIIHNLIVVVYDHTACCSYQCSRGLGVRNVFTRNLPWRRDEFDHNITQAWYSEPVPVWHRAWHWLDWPFHPFWFFVLEDTCKSFQWTLWFP